MIEIKCEECGKLTDKQPYEIKDYNHHFCGSSCSAKFRNKMRGLKHVNNTKCSWCNELLSRSPWYLKTHKNHFCNKSCATHHRNANKTKAYKRSKLELWLEEQLSLRYKDLEILYGDQNIIGSELDIFIPSLKLAVEINGIYHYEPIHGDEYLVSVQRRDVNKFQECQKNNISLCVINTTEQKYFSAKSSMKYLDVITKIIDEELSRK